VSWIPNRGLALTGNYGRLWKFPKSVRSGDDRRALTAPEPWFGVAKLGNFSVDITARV
jgi:hypothetical protein